MKRTQYKAYGVFVHVGLDPAAFEGRIPELVPPARRDDLMLIRDREGKLKSAFFAVSRETIGELSEGHPGLSAATLCVRNASGTFHTYGSENYASVFYSQGTEPTQLPEPSDTAKTPLQLARPLIEGGIPWEQAEGVLDSSEKVKRGEFQFWWDRLEQANRTQREHDTADAAKKCVLAWPSDPKNTEHLVEVLKKRGTWTVDAFQTLGIADPNSVSVEKRLEIGLTPRDYEQAVREHTYSRMGERSTKTLITMLRERGAWVPPPPSVMDWDAMGRHALTLSHPAELSTANAAPYTPAISKLTIWDARGEQGSPAAEEALTTIQARGKFGSCYLCEAIKHRGGWSIPPIKSWDGAVKHTMSLAKADDYLAAAALYEREHTYHPDTKPAPPVARDFYSFYSMAPTTTPAPVLVAPEVPTPVSPAPEAPLPQCPAKDVVKSWPPKEQAKRLNAALESRGAWRPPGGSPDWPELAEWANMLAHPQDYKSAVAAHNQDTARADKQAVQLERTRATMEEVDL